MDLLPLATIPRVGSESPSSLYRRNPHENTPPNNVVDISSDDDDPSEDTDDEDYDAFNPVHGGWISEESDDNESFVNSDKVRINEEEGMDVNDADDAVEDEVDHDDPEDTQSEEDIIPQNQKRGVLFVSDLSGKIRLEVRHLFQNLHHFRQVIRDFAVQEGFQLRRIRNERDRYTAKCSYEGCGWKIHASLIDDIRTFMIKTMENQHSCQKVYKNQEANTVWAKYRVLNKQEVINCKSYIMLHTYGSMVMEMNSGSMTTTGTGCMPFEDVYPVAFAIAEGESKQSWGWFLELFNTLILCQTHYCQHTSEMEGAIEWSECMVGSE
ncbi:hypothetical protein ACOSQ4_013815 [Xanthoceras sorbifolium]